eukprot:Opistho-2@36821
MSATLDFVVPTPADVKPVAASGRAPDRRFVVSAGDVQLACKAWGSPDRPTVVLVHGYPDNSEVWHAVATDLSADFHVVAYDVRGAGDSTTPKGMQAYRLERLSLDFEAVIKAVSPNAPVHLVAHDWGSIQSWESVSDARLAGRIASYTSCAGPCLDHVGHWMRAHIGRPSLASLPMYSALI